ncbi:unknown protein [Seminavis robusta]|uniref:Uncharacterized protein n=1 Tax=Seminavis robusta TaxID=568900 RepID=A0A9N8EYX9_9STRA|nr:unknown protein [Seminavis robusta]|eukprot:Sro2019_g311280.1 n/a (252) ;mRNA; r:1939-2694
MKIQAAKIALLSALLVCSYVEGASNLRKHNHEQSQPQTRRRRSLSLVATTINAVIDFFMPILNGSIQIALGNVPLSDIQQTTDLGQIDFGFCQAGGSLSYSVGQLQGLPTFEIETFELVPGTERFELNWGGLGGATWDGTWVVRASFDRLVSGASATISGDACLFGFDESVSGSIAMANPAMNFRIRIAGDSPNLALLGSSLAESIEFQEVSISYDSISLNIGAFGGNVEFDIDGTLEQVFFSNLNTDPIH